MTDLEEEVNEIMYESMTNSYMIITNKLTFEDLLDYNGCSLPFDPKKYAPITVINTN